jgi:hypothetical protein
MLILFQPAGAMEEFFKKVLAIGANIPKDPAVMKDLWAAHGMQVVGPPLMF